MKTPSNFTYDRKVIRGCNPLCNEFCKLSIMPAIKMTSSNGSLFHVTGPLGEGGGIHRSPVNSPDKGPVLWTLMFL